MKNPTLKPNRILLALLIILLIATVYLAYQLYFKTERGFINPAKVSSEPCIKKKPLSGKYNHIKIKITAEDINIRYFFWNNLNYANQCFDFDHEKTYTFNGYVPEYQGIDIPLQILVFSSTQGNQIDYGVEVYNSNDSLIHQIPKGGGTTKGTAYITRPLDIKTLIKSQP